MDISDFTIYKPSISCRLYCKDYLYTNNQKYNLNIYIGTWLCDMQSDPLDINLDINKYNYFGVTICCNSTIIRTDNIYNLEKLSLTPALDSNSPAAMYKKVTIPKLEQICSILDINSKQSYLIGKGGNCCICNQFDDWAAYIDNKFYCYKHTPGY